jgi:hypothetical protein
VSPSNEEGEGKPSRGKGRKKTAEHDPDRLIRDSAGRYHTEDERFEVETDTGGKWYLIDSERTDELGMGRVIGPYPTLPAVRAAIEDARTSPKGSPRLTVVGKEPRSKQKPRARPKPPPKPVTWLDRLDPAERTRAGRLIGALERLGLPDAEKIVRDELTGEQPVLARATLAARIWKEAIEPLSPAEQKVALKTVEALLRVLAGRSGPRPMDEASWRLVESDEPGRSIELSEDDLVRFRPTGDPAGKKR